MKILPSDVYDRNNEMCEDKLLVHDLPTMDIKGHHATAICEDVNKQNLTPSQIAQAIADGLASLREEM